MITYLSMTEQQYQDTVNKAVTLAIDKYDEMVAKGDVRDVSAWARFLKLDKRTVIKKIEQGLIKPISKNPYRISRYEIQKGINQKNG